jgi:hypothetical protein
VVERLLELCADVEDQCNVRIDLIQSCILALVFGPCKFRIESATQTVEECGGQENLGGGPYPTAASPIAPPAHASLASHSCTSPHFTPQPALNGNIRHAQKIATKAHAHYRRRSGEEGQPSSPSASMWLMASPPLTISNQQAHKAASTTCSPPLNKAPLLPLPPPFPSPAPLCSATAGW